MTKFEIGNIYIMHSPCCHDCTWSYEVVKRTASTVTLRSERGELKTCRINRQVSEWNHAETVHPLGRYSMAPSLSADRF